MKKIIVCATDFSDNAKNAADWAAMLSVKLNLPLVLYHCYHIPVMVNDIPFPVGNEAELDEAFNKLLDTEASRLKLWNEKLNVSGKIEPGFTNESISEFAVNSNAAYVVLGITGRNGMGQVLIGSTAVNVALHTKIPVLVVPHDAKSHSIKSIGLAMDNNHLESAKDLSGFFELVKEFDSTVEIVHVSTSPGENHSAELMHTDFESKGFGDIRYSIHAIQGSDVEEGLRFFADTNKIDLMTVIHKEHGFFSRIFNRSHTGKLAYKLTIPILVIHE